MTNTFILGFGYDDYKNDIYSDTQALSDSVCIIPNPKAKEIPGLEYTITNEVCYGVNVKTEKINPPINSTIYLNCDILDEIVLKNKFKISKDPSESLIFTKNINNVIRTEIKLYISKQNKKIRCIIREIQGFYKPTFDSEYELIYSGPALVVHDSEDIIQFLKYNRKVLVYSPQELIKYAEKYNGDDTLTLENLEELRTLLLSADESSRTLGYLTLASSNFMKYQESIKFMLNDISKSVNYFSASIPKPVRYIFSRVFNWIGNLSRITFPHNYKINKDDWNLLKEYANYHGYTLEYDLHYRFRCHFVNDKGEVNVDKTQID